MVLSRILKREPLRVLAQRVVVGGISERTVKRLMNKFERFATEAALKIAEYLAGEPSCTTVWLKPNTIDKQEFPKLTRLMNVLSELARVVFDISDIEGVRGRLLALHEAWRRSRWTGFAKLSDIS
jgi:hypothetical protein